MPNNKLILPAERTLEVVKILAKLDYFINFGLPLFKINHLEWALITDSILIL
jgi:hypothetical protein